MDKKYHIDYMHFLDQPRFGETILFQLGRLHCMPCAVVPEHTHLNLYELTAVTGVEGIVTTNGQDAAVRKGDIYLSFPADFHRIESSAERPLKYDFFAFRTLSPELEGALKRITAQRRLSSQRIIRNDKIASDLSSAIAEFGARNDYREEILSLLFKQITLYVIRSFQAQESPVRHKNVSSAEELCFQIMDYIDINIYSITGLTVLAQELGYHYSYLSNVFKETTGGTISEYYQTRRLETAKLLLSEGALKCGQIAEVLNYASLYSFSKAFKQKYGVSPNNFKKQR